MTELADHLRRAAVLRAIKDQAAAEEKTTTTALRDQLHGGDRLSARGLNGERIGIVWITEDGHEAQVTNLTLLLAWVREHAPHNIVEAIAPAYLDGLLSYAKRKGEAVTEDGEVLPGVTVSPKPGNLAMKVTEDERSLIFNTTLRTILEGGGDSAFGSLLPELETGDASAARARLVEAVHRLYLEAGAPATRSVNADGTSHTTIADAISGRKIPSWTVLHRIVVGLGGDPGEIQPLWVAYRAAMHTVDQLAGRAPESNEGSTAAPDPAGE
jgi:hypothetical protein